ncbi:uncharacterized protein MKZ38_008411 [Zalerion maritima]|uniref:Uncharacterized protein n=1 Tax=Zalerion maritima TaxID=339359 RepID=A0AAD5RHJ2_9PEZI|nr:uncharacterized protein MKZ38_008411 [Zalerion maritima]
MAPRFSTFGQLGVQAQSTSSYTGSNTEITFQTYLDTTGYTNPDVHDGDDATLYPIGDSIFAACVDDSLALPSSNELPTLGWAWSTDAPDDVSDSGSTLTYHETTLATLANTSDSGDDTSGGNSTTTDPGTGSGNSTTTPVTTSNSTYNYIVCGAGAATLSPAGTTPLLPSTCQVSLTPSHPPPEWVETDIDDKPPEGWTWSDVEAAAEKLYGRNPGTIQPSAGGERYDQSAFNVLSSRSSANGWSEVDAIADPDAKTLAYTHPPRNPMSTFTLSMNTKVIRAVRTNSTGALYAGTHKMGTDDGREESRTSVVDIDTKATVMVAAERAVESIPALDTGTGGGGTGSGSASASADNGVGAGNGTQSGGGYGSGSGSGSGSGNGTTGEDNSGKPKCGVKSRERSANKLEPVALPVS